jgi:hypothetical protein
MRKGTNSTRRSGLHATALGRIFLPVVLFAAASCSSNEVSEPPIEAKPGAPELLGDDCDPIVPEQCAFPFPSSVYLAADPSTKTGKRVRFGATTLPRTVAGTYVDAEAYADADGFSASAAALAYLPGATEEGLATPETIDRSLAPDSKTVLLDADTGERVPHFAELDATVDEDEERALIVRPVVRLKDGHRYIVAIRRVSNGAGEVIPPSSAFRALRDGASHPHPSVARRRALYDDIFGRLESAGVGRNDLQLAWDYVTASRDSNTRALVHMRDVALAEVGDAGPAFVIDKVEDAPRQHIARRIEGRMTVPLFLDRPDPGGRFVLGPDGLPTRTGTAEYPFLVLVPTSVAAGKAALTVQYGHGMLGSRYEIDSGGLDEVADSEGIVLFAVDLIGMSEPDRDVIQDAVLSEISKFRAVVDRQQQGVLNYLLAMRMMKGRLGDAPELTFDGRKVVDRSRLAYRGDSQGGIFGGTYMALTTDVERGVLGVPGMPYNLLLNRSRNFVPFFRGLKLIYTSPLDLELVLGITQMLWDRSDPSGYFPYVRENRLPNTPPHEVLLQVAVNDQQVTPLGAHFMARTIGLPSVAPAPRRLWGIEERPGPIAGSAIAEFDIGAPPLPEGNRPLLGREKDDPHSRALGTPEAVRQSLRFLREGVVTR